MGPAACRGSNFGAGRKLLRSAAPPLRQARCTKQQQILDTQRQRALRASASPMTRQRRHHTCRDFGDGRQTPPTHSPLVLTDPRTQLLSVAARRRSRTSPATAARRPGCARPVHKADQGGAASPQQPAHWAGAQCAARSHRPLRVEGFCFSLHSDICTRAVSSAHCDALSLVEWSGTGPR